MKGLQEAVWGRWASWIWQESSGLDQQQSQHSNASMSQSRTTIELLFSQRQHIQWHRGCRKQLLDGIKAILMGIPLFSELIYATNGSQEKGKMGASRDTKGHQEVSAKWEGMKREHIQTERSTQQPSMYHPWKCNKIRWEPETTHPAYGLQMPPNGDPGMDWGSNRSNHRNGLGKE